MLYGGYSRLVCGAKEDFKAGCLRNNAWQKDGGRKIEQIAFSPFFCPYLSARAARQVVVILQTENC
jgi:hypothetical protein